jgi:hypothetical protein
MRKRVQRQHSKPREARESRRRLRWAIDEIENLETDGKGYDKEGS